MVDMKEFIRWLFKETPDFDSERGEVAAERMGKVHKHMKRGVMSKAEAMDDFFDFMTSLKDEYQYASKRDVVVLEKDLREVTEKDGTRVTEKHRDCRLKDLFNSMDLNSNGKLTMSEFVRGLSSFGHDGSQEMVADMFRALDQEKSKTRVWDRKYHEEKRKEDEQTAQGKTVFLVPPCEIFEKRDMSQWNEDRADAIAEMMEGEESAMKEVAQTRKDKDKEKAKLLVKIAKLEDKINAKQSPNPEEDKQDNDDLRDMNRDLVATEKEIDKCTCIMNQQRFHYTVTKHKDGMVDWKEFKKAFDEACG
jgi:hypothetical protein